VAGILVIDDDQRVRETLRMMLEKAGHFVYDAADGAEGVQLFKDRVDAIDLVITDIIMPEKEGLETISELRESSPNIKILAISGGGRIDQSEYLAMAKAFGAQQVLSKPFTMQELLESLEQLLAS
jgi:CheY-like chemotaxis protein